MATINPVIIPARVLKNGTHKLRIAVRHKSQTSYIVTNIILSDPSQLKNGKVVKNAEASSINRKLRNLLDMYEERLDNIKNKDISYSTTKERGLLRSSFDEYLRSGGFPEIITTSVNAKTYINTLVNNILTNDIVNRYKIRYKAEFEKLAKHILNIVPSKINAKELQEIFSFGSSHTVENYISYIENAYLISTISKFSYKSKQRVTNYKAYAIDISLMNSRQNTLRGDNLGWRLETIVYIELLRRYKNMNYDIYYYAEQSYEVDFVICENNMVMQLIQVSYDISSPTTFKREVKVLSKAGAKLKCNNMLLLSLYTDIPSNSANENNIKVQDVVSWLISFKQDFGKDDKAEPYSK